MTFFNRKEDVLDVQLTQFGKHVLSKGVFKPVYYAFFDDDILYDGEYGGLTEQQNDIEDRIKTTPRMRTQYLFHGAETEINKAVQAQRMGAQEDDSLDRNSPKITLPQPRAEQHYVNILPMGSAKLGVQESPRWNIFFLDGKFKEEISYMSASNSPNIIIPQINLDLTYQTKAVSNRSSEITRTQYLNDLDLYNRVVQETSPAEEEDEGGHAGSPGPGDFDSNVVDPLPGTRLGGTTETLFGFDFGDNTLISLEEDEIVLEIEEKNGFTLNNNFELEIYEVEKEYIDGELTGREILIPLSFSERQNNFLITDDNVYIPENINASLANDITPTSAAYFFDIEGDSEIDQQILCNLKPADRTKGLFSKRHYECTEEQQTEFVNIYGVEESFEDPCD